MSQSSSSASRSRPPPPPLPLIMCPSCPGTRTRWYVSGTDRNPGIRFYKCPNQAYGGPCRFWLWEDQYAYYIIGVGINLLIEAAGGGSNVMFEMGRAIDEIRTAARNTMTICMLMLFVLLAKAAGWQ
ncbi:hypothetical protein CFC21_059614 [Triticum aestivum]|uniref:GRF-type domain-containing protein n=2 Tax=Triticum aestivum TaxID=4565 RepID=A0A9R1GPT1_WHEAT|nr:uncharacterized protein LOC123089646 [Triticum aestivum]KAF7051378.1 hypothetical protein CFC21_059614 [Triticum aestivum]